MTRPIAAGLAGLAGWERDGDAITKTYTFGAYMDGIAFVNGTAEAAEAADHHPGHGRRLQAGHGHPQPPTHQAASARRTSTLWRGAGGALVATHRPASRASLEANAASRG